LKVRDNFQVELVWQSENWWKWITFADRHTGDGRTKPGYEKILFCGNQARHDGLQYFWIDTCCIDKANKAELAFAIRSMFHWYRNAARCYVYLSDVLGTAICFSEAAQSIALRQSRWFTRGWTLQELLAPSTIDFFFKDGKSLVVNCRSCRLYAKL
jgi:hypothetical protein